MTFAARLSATYLTTLVHSPQASTSDLFQRMVDARVRSGERMIVLSRQFTNAAAIVEEALPMSTTRPALLKVDRRDVYTWLVRDNVELREAIYEFLKVTPETNIDIAAVQILETNIAPVVRALWSTFSTCCRSLHTSQGPPPSFDRQCMWPLLHDIRPASRRLLRR